MAYVALRQLTVDGSVVQPGDQIATATVDGWPTRDAYLNDGSIRYIADADLEQFQDDLLGVDTPGPLGFDETVSAPDRSILADQVAGKHRVR